MLVRKANREDPDQKPSDLGLPCLSRLFWRTSTILNFRTFTVSFKASSIIKNNLTSQPKLNYVDGTQKNKPGRVAQSVTCLATDACLTADPGVASSIPVRSYTFVEIDHEIISTVILLPSADSFKRGRCQLEAKVCARLLANCLFKPAQEKSVVR